MLMLCTFRSKLREKLIMEHVGERQQRHMLIIIHRELKSAAQLPRISHVPVFQSGSTPS